MFYIRILGSFLNISFPRCLVGVRVVSPDVWWGSVLFSPMFGGGPCCFPRCLVGVRVGHLFRFLCSVLFIFVLCLDCPMLSGSLYCPFLLSGSLYCPFLIAQCCQGLCTVHSWLPNSVSLTSIYKCTGASNVSIPTYDSRHICGKSLTNIS